MQEGEFQPQQFGKYLLTERIGSGGMAEIFRATAFGVEGFTKEICIKRILPTLSSDQTFVKMFIDEAKIAVSLHHANVVQVFDLGRIGEHYFIAMELVRGRDLLQIINACRAQRRRMPSHVAVLIVSELCKGLDYAHRVKVEGRPLGIIHRDVSPSNIMVSWEGEVKVADFGIAKAAHQEKTATGTMKGKYGYMSPEQVKGEKIDLRSDVFAAGVLLWESLVGKRLFKGETDLETLELVREARIPTLPSEFNKQVSPQLDQLVLRALAVDPADRFQTASELHQALAEELSATGRWVDTKTLAGFMQQLFAQVIKKEEEREVARARQPTPVNLGPPFVGPVTRPDMPFGPTGQPKKRMSPMAVGLIGTLVILSLAALVILFVWLAYRPDPPQRASDLETQPLEDLGTLSIDSEPAGAQIVIDGVVISRRTPAVIGRLVRSKPHQIELSLPGHQTWKKSIEFGRAQTMALQAQLVAVQPARKDQTIPDRKEEPSPQNNPRPKPVAYGVLNVNAEGAWAYIYVDGKKEEKTTPVYGLRLKAGLRTITLVNPKLNLSQTRKVRIRKGQSTNLVVKLR